MDMRDLSKQWNSPSTTTTVSPAFTTTPTTPRAYLLDKDPLLSSVMDDSDPATLKSRLTALTDEFNTVKGEAETAQQSLQITQRKVTELEGSMEDLKSALTTKSAEFDQASASLTAIQKKLDKTNQKLTDKKAHIGQLKVELTDTKIERDEFSHVIQNLNKTIAQNKKNHDEKEEELSADIHNLGEELKKLRTSTNKAASDYKKQVHSLQLLVETHEAATQNYQDKLASANDMFATLKTENQILDDEKKTIEAERDALHLRNEKLHTELGRAESSNRDLKANLLAKATIEKELSAKLESDQRTSHSLKLENASLTSQLNEEKQAHNLSHSHLTTLQSCAFTLQGNNQKLKSENENLTAQIATIQKENESLTHETGELRGILTALKNQFKTSDSALATSQTDISELQKKYNQLDIACKTIEAEKESLESELNLSHHTQNQLKKTHEEKQLKITKMEEEIHNLQEERSTLTSHNSVIYKDYKIQIEALKKSQENYAGLVGDLKGKVSSLEAAYKSQQKQLQSALASCEELTQKGATLQTERDQLKPENQILSQQVEDYREQVSRLTQESLASSELVTDMENQLSKIPSLESKVETLQESNNTYYKTLLEWQSYGSAMEIELRHAKTREEELQELITSFNTTAIENTTLIHQLRQEQTVGQQHIAALKDEVVTATESEKHTHDRCTELEQELMALKSANEELKKQNQVLENTPQTQDTNFLEEISRLRQHIDRLQLTQRPILSSVQPIESPNRQDWDTAMADEPDYDDRSPLHTAGDDTEYDGTGFHSPSSPLLGASGTTFTRPESSPTPPTVTATPAPEQSPITSLQALFDYAKELDIPQRYVALGYPIQTTGRITQRSHIGEPEDVDSKEVAATLNEIKRAFTDEPPTAFQQQKIDDIWEHATTFENLCFTGKLSHWIAENSHDEVIQKLQELTLFQKTCRLLPDEKVAIRKWTKYGVSIPPLPWITKIVTACIDNPDDKLAQLAGLWLDFSMQMSLDDPEAETGLKASYERQIDKFNWRSIAADTPLRPEYQGSSGKGKSTKRRKRQ